MYLDRTDCLNFVVSLNRGINEEKFDIKEWRLSIESEEPNGKKRSFVNASAFVNLDKFTSVDSLYQTDISDLNLQLFTRKIASAQISF